MTLALALALPAAAQIRIGQTSSFTGPVGPAVKEGTDAAKVYFDAVNARGGINGVLIELISVDDKFDAKLTAENARKLIDQGVVALFFNRGTPQTEAIMPLLMERKVPLIAPSTGAMVVHEPVHPWVFNVRATYQSEAERAVKHLFSIGLKRVAVLLRDDSFGADGAAGALRGFEAMGAKPVVNEKYARTKPDFAPAVQKIVKAEAQAVVFIGAGTEVADGTRLLRAAGSQAQIVTLSNNAAAGFIKAMGENARGVIVSQVFPSERSLSAPLIKELHDLMRVRWGGQGKPPEITPAMVEGFAAAKVLVEGLRRAAPDPTPAKLKAALEGMRKFDLGGLELGFSPTDHTGLEYSDLSIIDRDGHFRR
ncbi:MAG: ABC transporter substrate-binding protein [Rubrivivax sp.]|nr:ABC transporter substrate-binding protein [Rubrivivax sp.]